MFGSPRNENNLPLVEGFGALKWGASLEEAYRFYADFREYSSKTYDQYIKGKKGSDGVSSWYIRNNENLKVGGHSMDSVEYKFLEGKFMSVGMSVGCDKDPSCNIEQIFQDIVNAIRNIYGKPYEISSTTYENDIIVKKRGGVVKVQEFGWKIEDESISVTKSVDPDLSFITISIFSYQGYFSAIGQER